MVEISPSSLRKTRELIGMTVAQLAERSGVHQTTICRIEGGKVDPRHGSTWLPIVRALQSAFDADRAA